jgi:uncharacterized Fe-S cluster protein YjdI
MQTYTGQHVTVTYDENRCQHAGVYVRTLPKVFDPSRTPWIAPDEATADTLREMFSHCPPGALALQVTDPA